MTDLDININLARAMGWVEVSEHEWLFSNKVVGFLIRDGDVICVTCSTGLDENGGQIFLEKKFEYRDPVIFVAICKHWELDVNHHYKWVSDRGGIMRDATNRGVEKAAALCVIDAVKRGVK